MGEKQPTALELQEARNLAANALGEWYHSAEIDFPAGTGFSNQRKSVEDRRAYQREYYHAQKAADPIGFAEAVRLKNLRAKYPDFAESRSEKRAERLKAREAAAPARAEARRKRQREAVKQRRANDPEYAELLRERARAYRRKIQESQSSSE